MGVLNAWQRIDRVIKDRPFGDGIHGSYSSATIPTLVKDSCSGSADSTSFATSGSTFADGDLLFIHQTRGTGADNWEINKVVSGGGTASLTLKEPLHYTFTDSGSSQAQAIKIFRYTDCTVGGTWNIPAWDGNTGGFFPVAVKANFTGSNAVNGTSSGFLQPNGVDSSSPAMSGEGTGGASVRQITANGNGGGGGGTDDNNNGGGGGGGNASAGSNGSGGTGGSAIGTADGTTINMGGAGGNGQGTNWNDNSRPGRGGDGGGVMFLFAKNIISISATLNGDAGGNGTSGGSGYHEGGGGGGAGGSCVIVCQTASLGTNTITVAAGNGGTGINSGNGGNGSVGRIAVHHSGTITGSTSPSFTDVEDLTLKEKHGGMMMFL